MSSPEAIIMPIGQVLLVAAALGKSLGTLLGPSAATKMVYQDSSRTTGDEHEIISSNPLALLQSMDVVHPVGTLVLEALEGMEAAFGTSLTSLVTFCGALSTACLCLQEQGVPTTSLMHGLRTAEDLCLGVIRGMSVRTVDAGQQSLGYHDPQFYPGIRASPESCDKRTDVGKAYQQQIQSINRSSTLPFLEAIAKGLQHRTGYDDEESIDTDKGLGETKNRPSLSLPAILSVHALAALLIPDGGGNNDHNGIDIPDLERVHTRLVVGPEQRASLVVPSAAVLEVPSWERAAVEEAFYRRHHSSCSLGGKEGSFHHLPLATATITVAAVAIVLGDVSIAASASSAASSQTPVTRVFRSGEAMVDRLTEEGMEEDKWTAERLGALLRFGVEALVATGTICTLLRQALVSRGVLVLPNVSQGEAESAALASCATPVPRLEALTFWDLGRGRQQARRRPDNYEDGTFDDHFQRKTRNEMSSLSGFDPEKFSRHVAGEKFSRTTECMDEGGSQGASSFGVSQSEDSHLRQEPQKQPCRQLAGVVASLVEVGATDAEKSTYVPTYASRMGEGQLNPDVVVLLHQTAGAVEGWWKRKGPGAAHSEGNTTCQGGGHCVVLVMFCGPISSACEELRHRFWRITRRVTGALSEGLVLPGAGACEVVCAAHLELEARRMDEENADNVEQAVSKELCMPIVLRSVAAALDEVLLTCMANVGHRGGAALGRLSGVKKVAIKNILREPWHLDPAAHPADARSTSFIQCGLTLNVCQDLAVLSIPSINADKSMGHSVQYLGEGSRKSTEDIKGRLDHSFVGRSREERVVVLDNYGAKIGCFQRAVRLVELFVRTDGLLLPPSDPSIV